MKPQTGNMRFRCGASGGFSLVEIAVAVGLFAFGVVGVIGLFPAALAQRADAARDTRARLIAEQIFEALRGSETAPLLEKTAFVLPPLRDMTADGGDDAPDLGDLRRKSRNDFPLSLGFGRMGTTPFYIMPADTWKNGASGEFKDSAYVALISRELTGTPKLYKVEVKVGFPANLPEDKRRNVAFTSMAYMAK